MDEEKTVRVRAHSSDFEHPLIIELKLKVEHIEKNYVTKQEFAPVKIIAFGIAGLGLSSLFIAIIKSVLGG